MTAHAPSRLRHDDVRVGPIAADLAAFRGEMARVAAKERSARAAGVAL